MGEKFNPDMLKLARHTRGLEVDELSEKSGVPETTITRYEESRVVRITDKPVNYDETVLNKLADALGFPMAFFTREGRYPNPDHHIFICSME